MKFKIFCQLNLIIYFLFFSSCSFLIETDSNLKKNITTQEKTSRPLESLFCAKASSMRASKNAAFLNKHPTYNGSIAEQIVQNYLFEMFQNPDFFYSHPKIQIFIKEKESIRYFESSNPESPVAFYQSLDNFLTQEKSRKKFNQIKTELLPKLSNALTTSFSLSNFIRQNRGDFLADEVLAKHFLKGDDPLAPYESFAPISLGKLPANKVDKSAPTTFSTLQKYKKETYEINCNFDLNLFENFTSSLLDPRQFNSYYFTRAIDTNSFYIVLISNDLLKPIQRDADTGLIKGVPTKSSVPFCFKSDKSNFIMTVSTEGRDPAQHISHFIDYGIFDAENITDLIGHMKFTRHLFLKNPDRLLFESQKARNEQLTFFYTMNIPLYHMDKLGETLIYGKFNSQNQHSFILDERSEAQIQCQ